MSVWGKGERGEREIANAEFSDVGLLARQRYRKILARRGGGHQGR